MEYNFSTYRFFDSVKTESIFVDLFGIFGSLRDMMFKFSRNRQVGATKGKGRQGGNMTDLRSRRILRITKPVRHTAPYALLCPLVRVNFYESKSRGRGSGGARRVSGP
jgi:hypothetical protein